VELVGDREPADLRYEGDYVEAAIAVGEHSKAERIVADLEQRRRAAPRPWLDLMVARGRGLLAAAAGDVERGLEELRAGTDAGERLPMPVEIGRSLVIEGRLRRRLRQKLSARDAFHQAE